MTETTRTATTGNLGEGNVRPTAAAIGLHGRERHWARMWAWQPVPTGRPERIFLMCAQQSCRPHRLRLSRQMRSPPQRSSLLLLPSGQETQVSVPLGLGDRDPAQHRDPSPHRT